MKILLLLSCLLACQAKSLQDEENLVEELVQLLERAENADMRAKRLECPPSEVSDGDKQKIVDEHNKHRKDEEASNMKKLKWDDSLATQAQMAANQCELKHNFQKDCEGRHAGQNGAGGELKLDVVGYITNWHEENKGYTYATDACSIEACGHYTQVVWAENDLVGCGVKDCGDSKFFYCNYRPGGNMANTRPYLEGDACSKCHENSYPSGWRCEDKLCVACTLGTDGCNDCSKTCEGTDKKPDWYSWGTVQQYCEWGQTNLKFCDPGTKYYLGQGMKDCPKFCCEVQGGTCLKPSFKDTTKRTLKLVEEILE